MRFEEISAGEPERNIDNRRGTAVSGQQQQRTQQPSDEDNALDSRQNALDEQQRDRSSDQPRPQEANQDADRMAREQSQTARQQR